MKASLFSDEFPQFQSNKQLREVQSQFSHYDEGYVAGAMIPDYREVYEYLWNLFEPYADSHFLKQYKLKNNFLGRTWEMYLGSYLATNHFEFVCKDNAPDFEIAINNSLIYIEAISVNRGDTKDSVPEITYGIADIMPEESMLLRLSSGLFEKYKQIKKYTDKEKIKKDVPYCIAVNSGNLGFPQNPAIPLMAKCLYAIGHLTLTIGVGGKVEDGSNHWSHRPEIERDGKSSIPMGFFFNPPHNIISAVFWSELTVINHPEKLGSDMYVFHNPNALCPLDEKLFPNMTHVHLKNSILEYHEI